MVKTISVKDLRLHFADIRQDLERGVSFIVIYRSSPIGELRPLKAGSVDKQALLKKMPLFRAKKAFSAVDLVRSDRE